MGHDALRADTVAGNRGRLKAGDAFQGDGWRVERLALWRVDDGEVCMVADENTRRHELSTRREAGPRHADDAERAVDQIARLRRHRCLRDNGHEPAELAREHQNPTRSLVAVSPENPLHHDPLAIVGPCKQGFHVGFPRLRLRQRPHESVSQDADRLGNDHRRIAAEVGPARDLDLHAGSKPFPRLFIASPSAAHACQIDVHPDAGRFVLHDAVIERCLSPRKPCDDAVHGHRCVGGAAS